MHRLGERYLAHVWQVLVIGATNRISLMDNALLRPGRFDRILYMGLPSQTNRLRILEVHARDKPIGKDEERKAQILEETSRLTLGSIA